MYTRIKIGTRRHEIKDQTLLYLEDAAITECGESALCKIWRKVSADEEEKANGEEEAYMVEVLEGKYKGDILGFGVKETEKAMEPLREGDVQEGKYIVTFEGPNGGFNALRKGATDWWTGWAQNPKVQKVDIVNSEGEQLFSCERMDEEYQKVSFAPLWDIKVFDSKEEAEAEISKTKGAANGSI